MPVREIIAYDFDEFRLDVRNHRLLRKDNSVALTHKAFQILHILVQNFGQTVEKENIYQQLWADSFVEDANLTQHIYILRKTLGQKSSGEPYIETIARLGYRFQAEVEIIYAPNVISMPEISGKQPDTKSENARQETFPKVIENKKIGNSLRLAETEPNSFPPSPPEKEKEFFPKTSSSYFFRNKKLFLSLLIFLMFTAVGAAIYFRESPNQLPNEYFAPVKSIAILPFIPLGEESENEKLGLGMADAVITRLSKIRQIPVRPTSAVFRYTDQPARDLSSIGKELNVETVLEGTVQRDADRVRVSVRLINISDGKTIWAENFDENYTSGIFKVQDSISTKVTDALQINLTQGEKNLLEQHSTINTEAYQSFQMGVYFGNRRNKEKLEKAILYFQKAVELDPSYARAYALLADTYNMLAYYKFAEPEQMHEKARAAATKALELNDEMAEAYIALALLPKTQNDQRTGKELIERAIELSPYNSTARVRYGWILLGDDMNAAIHQMRLAQEYDPLSPVSNGALCNVLIFQKNIEEAIKYCEKSVALSPESPSSRILLADSYFLLGKHEGALIQINKRIEETEGAENLSAFGSLAFYYAKLGRRAEAEKIFNRLASESEKHPEVLSDLILISYALGKRDEGFSYFKQAYYKRRIQMPMFRFHPFSAEISSDQTITEFLKKENQKAKSKK